MVPLTRRELWRGSAIGLWLARAAYDGQSPRSAPTHGHRSFVFPLYVCVLVSGCATGGSSPPDADRVPPDAGTPDAAMMDGDLDASPDAPPDEDGDGVADDVDCAPSDPAVGNMDERACESDCAPGLERCTDGVWSDCDAPTDCDCTDGETRELDCSMCGTQRQLCGADGTWTDDGTCSDQGVCSPGGMETDTSDDCAGDGTRRRTCGDDCTWSEWACESGEARLWVHPSGGTEWARYALDPASPSAPSGAVRGAFNVDSANEAYVLTDSSYHVLDIGSRSWVRTGPLGGPFPEVGGATILSATSVPGRHTGSPGMVSVTLLLHDGLSGHAEVYDYDVDTRTFTHTDTVDPCCDEQWESPLSPATGDVTARWLDVDNEDGWPDPTTECESGPTAAVYLGTLTPTHVHVEDTGSCFQYVERTAYGDFPPFGRAGAPSATSLGATFWHGGLYVLRADP